MRRRHGPRIFCRIRSLLSLHREKKKAHIEENWRHLSPVFPPLPAQAEDDEDEDFEFDLFPPQFSHITLVDRARHTLYTIPEEESLDQPSQTHSSIYSTPSPMSSPRASSLSICTPGSSSSTSSLWVHRPPLEWIKDTTPEDPYDEQLVGDESQCKRKLASMVQAATQHAGDDTGEVELFFDSEDALRVICITRRNQQTECWRFRGNVQYMPPEMASGVYAERLADVWIMGICLYRMLVGKYPFVAPNHRKLFGKMTHCDFSIPQQVSEDAKDLLRRMLSPRSTRASLDLVLFHPWLKPILSSSYLQHASRIRSQQPSQQPPSPSLQVRYNRSSNTIKKKRSGCHRHIIRHILRMLRVLTRGPYPPPKKPYRELGLLGLKASS